MIAKGTFEVTMKADPPFEAIEGVSLGRATFEKRFTGALEASSVVNMLGARTPVATSAGYVAIERVIGTLDGKRGSFVLLHTGLAHAASRSLTVTVVPDSATGDLMGLSGTMKIDIVDGKHLYELEYAFAT